MSHHIDWQTGLSTVHWDSEEDEMTALAVLAELTGFNLLFVFSVNIILSLEKVTNFHEIGYIS